MNNRFFATRWVGAALTGLLALNAAAQTAPALPGPGVMRLMPAEARAGQRDADYIVALVNSEPVTRGDVQARLARIEPPAGGSLPPRDELERQVLERLILERTQLQWAQEIGLRVSDEELAEAEANVARQNRIGVNELQQRLQGMGLSLAAFRAGLRNELLLQRVREREVDARVRVSEQDIDAYLREHAHSTNPADIALNLAQVLVQVPENADAMTLERLRQRAADVTRRARAGEDFAALARTFSDSPEARNGGELGLRLADRYPTLFAQATLSLPVGAVTEPVRSGAGFHVLKVLAKRNTQLPESTVTQTRARHILLTLSPQRDEAAAVTQIQALRQQIVSGQARFEDVARANSQDGSARQGGDLGWVGPGQFVPEFEQVMNGLSVGQVSEPVVSRFGVHLIEVLERRTTERSEREQREVIRGVLRQRKAAEDYEEWARDLRAKAYVEYRAIAQ